MRKSAKLALRVFKQSVQIMLPLRGIPRLLLHDRLVQ